MPGRKIFDARVQVAMGRVVSMVQQRSKGVWSARDALQWSLLNCFVGLSERIARVVEDDRWETTTAR
jgi:hypothetical protein